MKVQMPYGIVEVETKEQAKNFIVNACNNCERNNSYNPCSGAKAKKCQEKINFVKTYFKE